MKDEGFNINIAGFTFYHFARQWKHPNARRASGGIGIFISNTLKNGVKITQSHEAIIWIQLDKLFFKLQTHVYIACTYIPPEGSTYCPSGCIFDILVEQIASHKNCPIFLCGDLNARTGCMNDFDHNSEDMLPGCSHWSIANDYINPLGTRVSKDKVVNSHGKKLLQLCKATGFCILNGRLPNTDNFTCYTAQGNSLIDYLLTQPKHVNLLSNFSILPKRIESDHCIVYFELNIKSHEVIPVRNNNIAQGTTYFKWDKTKVAAFRDSFKSNQSQCLKEDFICELAMPASADSVCSKFYEYFEYSLSCTFQQKQRKAANKNTFPHNGWFCEECKKVKSVVNNYAKSHDLSDSSAWQEYVSLCKEYKKLIQRKRRQFKDQNLAEFQNMLSNKPDDYWNFWKNLKHSNNNINNDITIDNFVQYFSDQNHPPQPEYFDTEHMDSIREVLHKCLNNVVPYCAVLDDILNSCISEEEVRMQLIKLKNGKACGTDGIASEFFKYVPSEIVPCLTALFNYILTSGSYPTQWSEGIINPIHKSGAKDLTDNFRKITILVAMGKIFESVLNNRLYYKNEVLSSDDVFQSGFMKNTRTIDNIFVLNTLIEKQKMKRQPLYVCFVDFSKAFDYVNRSALLYKLGERGVKGNFCKVLLSMFEKSHAKVRWNNQLSASIDSLFGVLQGGIISPKLFTEYLSDIGSYLHKNCGIVIDDALFYYLLYADDLVLCSDSAEGLQKQIDGLFNYCKKWHMLLNMGKTKILVFNGKKHTHKFKYNDSEIEICDKYKYLGIWFTANKKNVMSASVDHLVNQARKALFQAYKYSSPVVGKLSPSLAFKVFDSQICPILEYGCEILFQGKEIDQIEKFHLSFLKNVLNVRQQTPSDAIYAETGRCPMYIRQQLQALKYWTRILSLPQTSIVKQAYNSLFILEQMAQDNWCSKISKLLKSLDMHDIWNSQCVLNEKAFLSEVKIKLYDIFESGCLERIQNCEDGKKLRTYKLFKNAFGLEPYLTKIHDSRYRNAITRFRLSSHNLKIELGRHSRPKIPVAQRICQNCLSNKVEDEKHFLLECQKHSNERNKLLSVLTPVMPNFSDSTIVNQFVLIMQCKNLNSMIHLGKFLHNCM